MGLTVRNTESYTGQWLGFGDGNALSLMVQIAKSEIYPGE